jgi:hypothetical protein
MPIYKGTTEVTSGNLYKATTEIENGYKGTDVVYVNETTQSFALPTGQSLTYTTPVDIIGSPGSALSPTVTFTGTASALNTISGTGAIAGLPTGLTYTQAINNTNPGNMITFTISGTYPTTSNSSINLTISGLTITVGYSYTITASGTVGAGLSLPSNYLFTVVPPHSFNYIPVVAGTVHNANGLYDITKIATFPTITPPTGITDNGIVYPWTSNNFSTNASGATGGTFDIAMSGGTSSAATLNFTSFLTASNFAALTVTSGAAKSYHNVTTVVNLTPDSQTFYIGVSAICTTSGGSYSFISDWKRTDTGVVFGGGPGTPQTIAAYATVQIQAGVQGLATFVNYSKIYIGVNGVQHEQTGSCTDYGVKLTSS